MCCLTTSSQRTGDARRSRAAGFSLLELVLVLVLIAILSTVGLGRFFGSVSHHGLDAATRRVTADLELARQKALALGRPQTVTFTRNTASYVLDGEPDLNRPEQTYRVSLSASPYACAISSLDLDGAGGTVLTFDAYGRPGLAAGAAATTRVRLVLTANGRSNQIIVDRFTGRTDVEEGA